LKVIPGIYLLNKMYSKLHTMLVLIQKQNTARRSNTHEFFFSFTPNKINFLSILSQKYETRCSFLSKVTDSTT